MLKVIVTSGVKARRKLLKGAMLIGQIVGASLGPRGRNAIIQTKYSAPQVTNDGVTIARHIMLEDEIEDLGAQTLIDGAMKTDDRAGDGTTTAIVIASKIVEDYSQRIEKEDKISGGIIGEGEESVADVNKMAREILDTGKLVVEKLIKVARPLKELELKNVISSSLGLLFPEYVDSIADTVQEVGKDGYIAVEDNWHTKYGVETELIKGMRFEGTYITPYMVNSRNKEAIQENVMVFVCNYDLATLNQFRRNLADPKSAFFAEFLKQGYRKIVLIANSFEKPLIRLMAETIIQARSGNTNLIDFLCIKAPAMTTERMQDIAVYCGAEFFDKNRKMELGDVNMSHLGFVKKIIVNEDEVMMLGGRGAEDKELPLNSKEKMVYESPVSERIAMLKEEIEGEKDPAFKEQKKRRLGALTSGFATIRVGAVSESERVIVKRKIEDSVHSAQNALEEGVVKGGGLALKEIADELGNHPMYGALCAPYDRIQRSAGGNLEILDMVIDPVKVTRVAVETACSVAASLITAEIGIANKVRTLWDTLEEKLFPQMGVDDDFRDDVNQEQRFK